MVLDKMKGQLVPRVTEDYGLSCSWEDNHEINIDGSLTVLFISTVRELIYCLHFFIVWQANMAEDQYSLKTIQVLINEHYCTCGILVLVEFWSYAGLSRRAPLLQHVMTQYPGVGYHK